MGHRTISVCVAILTTFCVANAVAASFDCGKAKTLDEVAVCRNADISALDSEMGGLWYAYNLMPMGMGSSGARRDDARQFLRDRSVCAANVACLRKLYAARNQALRSGIKNAVDIMIREDN